jgi:chorismate mutase
MSDIPERVMSEQDPIKKILAKIPGFKGYIERGDRRMSDKLLREKVANEFDVLYQRISSLQRDIIGQGELQYVDDLEASALKLRQFIDRVRTASYGYAGLFDAIKINQDELGQVYQYDYALLELADEVRSAIDNVETSIGTEGLVAAIHHLTSVSQQCVDAFNKRTEVMQGIAE